MEQYLRVGVITTTHGIRGEVKVFPTTDDAKRFQQLKEVFLDTGAGQLPLEIQGVRFFKKSVIVKFRGIDDINAIEKYRGCALFAKRSEAPALGENEYYIADLIDMEVYADGVYFGRLKDVMETGANEVYIIDSEKYGEVLLPAIRQCIRKVDAEGRRMDVHLLKGLVSGEKQDGGGEERS